MAKILPFDRRLLGLDRVSIPTENFVTELVDLNMHDPNTCRVVSTNGFDLEAHRARTAAGMLQVRPGDSGWVVVHSFTDVVVDNFGSHDEANDFARRLTDRWLEATAKDKGKALRFDKQMYEGVAKKVQLPTLQFGDELFLFAPDYEFVTLVKLVAYQAMSHGAIHPDFVAPFRRTWFQQQMKAILGEHVYDVSLNRLRIFRD